MQEIANLTLSAEEAKEKLARTEQTLCVEQTQRTQLENQLKSAKSDLNKVLFMSTLKKVLLIDVI